MISTIDIRLTHGEGAFQVDRLYIQATQDSEVINGSATRSTISQEDLIRRVLKAHAHINKESTYGYIGLIKGLIGHRPLLSESDAGYEKWGSARCSPRDILTYIPQGAMATVERAARGSVQH